MSLWVYFLFCHCYHWLPQQKSLVCCSWIPKSTFKCPSHKSTMQQNLFFSVWEVPISFIIRSLRVNRDICPDVFKKRWLKTSYYLIKLIIKMIITVHKYNCIFLHYKDRNNNSNLSAHNEQRPNYVLIKAS